VSAVELVTRLSSGGAPDPSEVKPGLVAFVVVVLLCVATVLLWLSMRKQLRKIRFEEKEIPGRRRRPGSTSSAPDEPAPRV
jgi:hypothetical protein